MTEPPMEISPKTYARIGGVLYLVIIVGGIFAEIFVRSGLVVSTDATASATNIMAAESLWRFGFATTLVMLLCAVPLSLILYMLLRPVNRNVALLATFFNLVSISIEGLNDLHHYAAVLILSGADYLKVFEPGQLHALALLSVKLFDRGYDISLVFFGFFCIFTGYLLFRSAFFPRILGVMMAMAGVCYVINSFVNFLALGIGNYLFPYILLPCFLGEASLCLWLMVMGVKVPSWKEKASAWRDSGA